MLFLLEVTDGRYRVAVRVRRFVARRRARGGTRRETGGKLPLVFVFFTLLVGTLNLRADQWIIHTNILYLLCPFFVCDGSRLLHVSIIKYHPPGILSNMKKTSTGTARGRRGAV